jgi:hypothetical protein
MDEIFRLPGRPAAGNQLVVALQDLSEWLTRLEGKYTLLMGLSGEYPVIKITKLKPTKLK